MAVFAAEFHHSADQNYHGIMAAIQQWPCSLQVTVGSALSSAVTSKRDQVKNIQEDNSLKPQRLRHCHSCFLFKF